MYVKNVAPKLLQEKRCLLFNDFSMWFFVVPTLMFRTSCRSACPWRPPFSRRSLFPFLSVWIFLLYFFFFARKTALLLGPVLYLSLVEQLSFFEPKFSVPPPTSSQSHCPARSWWRRELCSGTSRWWQSPPGRCERRRPFGPLLYQNERERLPAVSAVALRYHHLLLLLLLCHFLGVYLRWHWCFHHSHH